MPLNLKILAEYHYLKFLFCLRVFLGDLSPYFYNIFNVLKINGLTILEFPSAVG